MDLRETFANPPNEFGPVPFWWWVGEPLTRERLGWQLDQLRSKGFLNAIISYNHTNQGETNLGDPPLFSSEWWNLFRWVVNYCKEHGMQIGFQDYTIVNRKLQEIGRASPEMNGFGSLHHLSCEVSNRQEAFLQMDRSAKLVAALAYRKLDGSIRTETLIDLTSQVEEGELRWLPPTGQWLVVLIFLQPNPFDPTHPVAAAKAIDELYAIFEKNCPGELGKTISILFQDELDFFNHNGEGFPIWSQRIEQEFSSRKGYALRSWLAGLWHDLGPMTSKVRIDYNDVCVALMEERYFRPIFDWCERRGVLLGNDNCGRGRIAEGHRFYGDAFRTMRWYGAPGNDDAGPVRGYAFNSFKINSSIAHLYRRPRVWNEAFHSSGWGFTPTQIIAGFNEDCVYGATFFNLHGLYYTTFGSWWEWASPDFHFRQPYWEHTDALSLYVKRISYLLSQGVHRCDVAIVYPITTVETGLDAGQAEKHAFGLGRYLFEAGIDFDFVDFESLERATVTEKKLQVSGECYRVLIFPELLAVRWSTLEKTRDFASVGGIVIGFGCLPRISERAGSHDAQLDALVAEIWTMTSVFFVSENYALVKDLIDRQIERDFVPSASNVFGLHRLIEGKNVYFVFNRSDQAREVEVSFRATGAAQRWDAWNGAMEWLTPLSSSDQHTRLGLTLEAREGQLVVFDSHLIGQNASGFKPDNLETLLEFEGEWEFELLPTMDNRFGDYRLPASNQFIGPEARRFRYQEETEASLDFSAADFDDTGWPEVLFSFGPRFWCLGPIPAGTDLLTIEKELQLLTDKPGDKWKPYSFSLQWGIENDAFLQNPYAGPHGLKKRVPDEFIDLGDGSPGEIYYLWTSVVSAKTQSVPMVMGSRSQFEAWLNHQPILRQSTALLPGEHTIWKLPHYQSSPQQKTVTLREGDNPLLLKFVIPDGQRMRAYVAFDPPIEETPGICLPWFTKTDSISFDYCPNQTRHSGWYRFDSPPGLLSMDISARGPLRVWVDGRESEVILLTNDQVRVTIAHPVLAQSKIAIRAEQPSPSYAGDTIPEPIRFRCGAGLVALKDWRELGLSCYSGGAWYRKSFNLEKRMVTNNSLWLQLGKVSVTAEVRLNGRLVCKKIAPPWTMKIDEFLREGENRLEILVMNTLANHYSEGIPSPYVFTDQLGSGLLGPVRILARSSTT